MVASVFSLWNMLAREMTFAWVGCDGTVVSRVEAGKLDISTTEKNLPGCQGPRWIDTTLSLQASLTGYVVPTIDSTGATISQSTWSMHPQSYDPELDWALLDLAQTDIVAYRTELMKARQIRYANALRSLRMRNAASMNSKTDAYLMQDDAVIVSGSGNGWTQVQGGVVAVTDTYENTVDINTQWKADGYIATRLLRDPNPSDLVRIGQADQQFWSDIARVNVSYSVNLRAHPWYGATILAVLTDDTPLYVVSTVDNWSEVIDDTRTLHGYIRSDYLTIDKYQRKEIEPLLK